MNSKLVGWVLSAVVLLGVAYGGYTYLSGPAVLAALGSVDPWLVPPVLALSTLYLLIKAWRFRMMLGRFSPTPTGVVLRGYLAGEGPALLPGGVAVRAGLFGQVGVPVAHSGAVIAMTSALDQGGFLLGTLLAALWTQQVRQPALLTLAVLAGLGALLLVPAVRRWAGGGLGWAARKLKMQSGWGLFTAALRRLAAPALLLRLVGLTVLMVGVQVLILDLCSRSLGWSLPLPTLFAAYVVPTLLGRASPLPGGVGVTEAGMTGLLVAQSAMTPEVALIAVTLFRVATVLYNALLGALVYFFGWRGAREAALA